MNPPGPLLYTHFHTVYIAYSDCLPTCLNPLAERTCFSQAGMADPGQFNAVLDWAFLTRVLMYTLIASVGYGVFGDETQSPVLSNLPVEGGLATVVCLVKLVVALSVFCSYPILMNVMVLELEEALNVRSPGPTADAGNGDAGESSATQAAGTGQGRGPWQRQRREYLVRRTVLRSCCVGATAVIAVLVPFFMAMMGLIGSCCLGVIVFILPVLFDWRLRTLQGAVIERWRWVSGGVIIVTGLVGGDHLHFGVIVGGLFVNPIEWFDANWIKNNIISKLNQAKQTLGGR